MILGWPIATIPGDQFDDEDIRTINMEELFLAEEYLKRGDTKEALIHLGRALGDIWERSFS